MLQIIMEQQKFYVILEKKQGFSCSFFVSLKSAISLQHIDFFFNLYANPTDFSYQRKEKDHISSCTVKSDNLN